MDIYVHVTTYRLLLAYPGQNRNTTLQANKHLITMPPSKTAYPRSTLKRIIEAHSNRRLSKNADILVRHFVFHAHSRVPLSVLETPKLTFASIFQVFLDYVLFLQE